MLNRRQFAAALMSRQAKQLHEAKWADCEEQTRNLQRNV